MTQSNTSAFGRLTRVELRQHWLNESTAFTPWLAHNENLALLGEVIGIDLELEAQEQSVGRFRADLLCKDTVTKSWVLIENQIEPTDHCHLGQLLTYAAGLQAVTVVWVAQTIREEHRAALDWLNEITDDRFNFFGLEIELWQIGDSLVAPKFNAVCKPNGWSRDVQEGARGLVNAPTSDTGQLYLEYWTLLREYLRMEKSFLRSQKPSADYWTGFALGRSDFNLTAILSKRRNRITAAIVTLGPSAKHYYHALFTQKDAVEAAMGDSLSWEERPEGVESRIAIHMNDIDLTKKDDWPRQHFWFREKLEKLHQVCAPRIKLLPAFESD